MKKTFSRAMSLFLALVIVLSLGVIPVSAASTTSWASMNISTSNTIKCYVKGTSNVTTYKTDALSTKSGSVYVSDEMTVKKIAKNSSGTWYAYINYPISGGTKNAYILLSAITSSANAGTQTKATAKISTIYRRANTTTYGSSYISKGDKVYKLATSGSYTQVLYPISSGWKMAWIKTTDANKYLGDGTAQNTSTDPVTARLDEIANGKRSYNSNTVMAVGKKFTGYRANEQCKGYAKNVFYICFGVQPGSTKDNDYQLNSVSGMKLINTITGIKSGNSSSQNAIKNLFASARPGDFVQMKRQSTGTNGPHSAIVYNVTSTGVTFLEANTDGKNTVMLNTYTWAQLAAKNQAMSVYTATNYKLK